MLADANGTACDDRTADAARISDDGELAAGAHAGRCGPHDWWVTTLEVPLDPEPFVPELEPEPFVPELEPEPVLAELEPSVPVPDDDPEPVPVLDSELPLLDDELAALAGVVVAVVVVVLPPAVEAERRWPSAGSCPETRRSVIISQVATNRASAPAITRRRRARARSNRASRMAPARARAASGGEGAGAG
ncbi:MAG: hypothetical protein JOZ64_01905 [Solirubrobacterales bacterium]|nr:hypothetical protein [Solirubrobacterales bacterium]